MSPEYLLSFLFKGFNMWPLAKGSSYRLRLTPGKRGGGIYKWTTHRCFKRGLTVRKDNGNMENVFEHELCRYPLPL